MQISNESGEQQPVTQCVAISRDAASAAAIAQWAASRRWLCQVESDPLLAWSRLLLIEKTKAERARWGLQAPGRTVLLIDDRACDEQTAAQLLRAFDRYTPTASRITLQNGAVPNAGDAAPSWPETATEFRDESDTPEAVDPGHGDDTNEAEDDDDGRLTAAELQMLLGDDTRETIS